MINVDSLVEQTLNNQFTDTDIFDFIDIETQAEMFRELVGLIGSLEADKNLTLLQNRSEYWLAVNEYIEKSLTNNLKFKLGARAA